MEAADDFCQVANRNDHGMRSVWLKRDGQVGRDNYPDACIDAPGVDRAKLHEYIGNAALKFFDAN